jgi:hypothetical protein
MYIFVCGVYLSRMYYSIYIGYLQRNREKYIQKDLHFRGK